MTVIIGGSGTANGISYFSSPTTFGGTLATALRGISNASVPAGSILQIQSVTKTDVFSSSASSWVDITGLSLSITPFSTTSKILIQGFVSHGGPSGTVDGGIRFVRNSTPVGIADAASNRAQTSFSGFYRETYELGSGSGAFLDSPSTTSATTYKLQMKANGSTLYINRTNNDGDFFSDERGISTLIAIELAQ